MTTSLSNDITQLQAQVAQLTQQLEEKTVQLHDCRIQLEQAQSRSPEHDRKGNSALLLGAIFERSPVGIAITDLEGRYVTTNSAYQALVGYAASELLELSTFDLTHPSDRQINEALFEELLESRREYVQLEKRHACRVLPFCHERGYRWVRCNVSLIHNSTGQPEYAIAIVEDINERKAAEATLQQLTQELESRVAERTQQLEESRRILQQKEHQYRSIFEAVNDGIFINDLKTGMLEDVNPAACRIHGYTYEEMKQIQPKDFIHPDSLHLFREFNETVQLRKSFYCEAVDVCKDGTLIDVEVTGSLCLLNGKPHSLAVVRDISDRKRAERLLQASLQEKEVLLKEIHHRVKNNMQMVSSLINLQSISIQDPAVLLPFIESQHRIKVMALIHEKLYQSENLDAIYFPDYVQTLVIDLIHSYRVQTSRIDWQLNIADITLTVDIALTCGLIINELVSNALKYAFPNQRSGQLAIDFVQDNPRTYRLTIRDTGVGLPENLQIDHLESLGLQLVQALVKKLRGTFTLACETGTQFHVIFPIPEI